MPFGDPRVLESYSGTSSRASVVPMSILQNLAYKQGLPITVSGTDNVTFNLNASVTNPVPLWIGEEFTLLQTSVSYTWAAGANNTILSSAGAVTASQSPALGVWYFYLGITDEGTIALYPSATAPSYVQAGGKESDGGILAHPGTSRTTAWVYVGWQLCTATDPTFAEFTKIGKQYLFANDVYTAATAGTSFAALGFSGVDALPAHDVKVSGYLETGATAGDATHVAASSAGIGEQNLFTPAAVLTQAPFGPIAITSGQLFGKHTANAGDVFVTVVEDVV